MGAEWSEQLFVSVAATRETPFLFFFEREAVGTCSPSRSLLITLSASFRFLVIHLLPLKSDS